MKVDRKDFEEYCKSNDIEEKEVLSEIQNATADILNFIFGKAHVSKIPGCAVSIVSTLLICSVRRFIKLNKQYLSPDNFKSFLDETKVKMREIFKQF